MRLAVFTSKYPARVATFFERDMRALVEAGVEIHVFAIYPLDPSMWRYRLDLLGEDVLPRERVHHLSLPQSLSHLRPWPARKVATFVRDSAALGVSAARLGIGPLAKSVYLFPKAWAWARQYPDNYDHILAYWGNYAATCAYIFHRLANPEIPFSMWLHAGTDLYCHPVHLREKMLYADSIVTCCAFNREFISERYADIAPRVLPKVHVCYHGLDLSTFPYEVRRPSQRRIIAVGRHSPDKGFDYLLRAVGELAGRGVEVELELLGDGKQTNALRALARELGIADKVHFRGWVPFGEALAAMRAATLLVHPSCRLGDGLPNVIREAMAVGTPVIASRVAGIPEALDDGRCGVLVPPKDVGALATAIETLLTNEALRRCYAERARRHTENEFDMWRNGRRLAEHLRSVRRLPERELGGRLASPTYESPSAVR
jgi:colanic acid/amylovoran biosynthesis glycosyltransferase